MWIHVDDGPAGRGLCGTTIAHGYLTLSLISTFLDESFVVVGADVTINYGLNRVRFPAPVPSGSRLRAHGIVDEVTPVVGGHQMTIRVTVEAEGLDKPVRVAGQRRTPDGREPTDMGGLADVEQRSLEVVLHVASLRPFEHML